MEYMTHIKIIYKTTFTTTNVSMYIQAFKFYKFCVKNLNGYARNQLDKKIYAVPDSLDASAKPAQYLMLSNFKP